VRTTSVGLRELQRQPGAVLEQIEQDGTAAVLTRHGRPIAALIPIALAQPWVLLNRPLDDHLSEDEAFWPVEAGVRQAPRAMEAVEALPEQARRRLLTAVRKLRRIMATGRIAIHAGHLWALVDLRPDEEPTLLDVARRAELERWLFAAGEGQPM